MDTVGADMAAHKKRNTIHSGAPTRLVPQGYKPGQSSEPSQRAGDISGAGLLIVTLSYVSPVLGPNASSGCGAEESFSFVTVSPASHLCSILVLPHSAKSFHPSPSRPPTLL